MTKTRRDKLTSLSLVCQNWHCKWLVKILSQIYHTFVISLLVKWTPYMWAKFIFYHSNQQSVLDGPPINNTMYPLHTTNTCAVLAIVCVHRWHYMYIRWHCLKIVYDVLPLEKTLMKNLCVDLNSCNAKHGRVLLCTIASLSVIYVFYCRY